jgi:WD40 repeat protein
VERAEPPRVAESPHVAEPPRVEPARTEPPRVEHTEPVRVAEPPHVAEPPRVIALPAEMPLPRPEAHREAMLDILRVAKELGAAPPASTPAGDRGGVVAPPPKLMSTPARPQKPPPMALLVSSFALIVCAAPVPAPAPLTEPPRSAEPTALPSPAASASSAPVASAAPVHLRPPADWRPLALRPDGRALAAWGLGETRNAVQIWDLEHGRAGEFVPEAKEMGGCRITAWSPDGRSLARMFPFSEGAGLLVWDLVKHADWRGATGPIEHASWSPDGSRIVVGSDFGNVHLFDPRAKRLVRTAQLHDPISGALMALSWSPDSTRLAILQISNSIDLWDAKTGATQRVIHAAPSGLDLAVGWSPDSALLAVPTATGGLELFDGHTGASKRVLRADPRSTEALDIALAWSPDGATVALISRSKLEVWDLKSAKLRASLGVADVLPHSLAFSPDGSLPAFDVDGGRGIARLWDMKSGSAAKALGPCIEVAFSRDGTQLTCSAVHGDTSVVEVYDGRTAERLPPHTASGRPIATGMPFVNDPNAGARLIRTSDGLGLGFYNVEVAGRSLPIAATADGYYMGDREAARKLLVRAGVDGKDEPLPEVELAAHERSSLLADFLADRPIAGP